MWATQIEGIRLATSFEIPYANAAGRPVDADSARAFKGGLRHDPADVEADERIQRFFPPKDQTGSQDHSRVHHHVAGRHGHAPPVIKDACQDI